VAKRWATADAEEPLHTEHPTQEWPAQCPEAWSLGTPRASVRVCLPIRDQIFSAAMALPAKSLTPVLMTAL
jgi:hypothetical protein